MIQTIQQPGYYIWFKCPNVPLPRSNYYRKSFSYIMAPRWNSLPCDIRNKESLEEFKRKINDIFKSNARHLRKTAFSVIVYSSNFKYLVYMMSIFIGWWTDRVKIKIIPLVMIKKFWPYIVTYEERKPGRPEKTWHHQTRPQKFLQRCKVKWNWIKPNLIWSIPFLLHDSNTSLSISNENKAFFKFQFP